MSSSITLNISLFGAFRPYGSEDTLKIEVPKGANIIEIKNILKSTLKQLHPDFNRETLVDESALADSAQILAEDAILTESTKLAILPPVCGG